MKFNHASQQHVASGAVLGVVAHWYGNRCSLACCGKRSALVAIDLLPRVFAGI